MKKIFFPLALVLSLAFFSCSKKQSSQAPPSVIANSPLQYVLEDISGTVMIQSAGETQPEPAEEEQTIQAGDEITTQAGAEASLTLNETTLFHLSENSDVKVDQLARNDTEGFTSRISLAAGKILSEVEKLSESHSTFEIETGGVVCGVRGTSFEVEKQDTDIQTTTYNGVVAVQKDNNSQTVGVNEHSDFSLTQGAFQPKRVLTPEERTRYEAWKTRLALVREKAHKRLEYLRSLDRRPGAEREKILEQLNGVKGKDRLKAIRQAMNGQQNPSNPNFEKQSEEKAKENPQVEQRQEQREEAIQERKENHPVKIPKVRERKP